MIHPYFVEAGWTASSIPYLQATLLFSLFLYGIDIYLDTRYIIKNTIFSNDDNDDDVVNMQNYKSLLFL